MFLSLAEAVTFALRKPSIGSCLLSKTVYSRTQRFEAQMTRVHLVTHDNPESFRGRVLRFLAKDPRRNQLIYEMSHRLERLGSPEHPAAMWSVEQDGQVIGAALRTGAAHALLLSMMPSEAIQPVIEKAAALQSLTGFRGERSVAEAFAEQWFARTCERPVVNMELGFYELTRVILPLMAPGGMRLASASDLDLMCSWEKEFTIEANLGDGTHDPRPGKQRVIENGQQFLWQDHEPVSAAIWTYKTDLSTKITGVYTPKHARGKNYARNLVACLSQKLLDEGSPRCVLYTDLSNPTSNALYKGLGYRLACFYRNYEIPQKNL